MLRNIKKWTYGAWTSEYQYLHLNIDGRISSSYIRQCLAVYVKSDNLQYQKQIRVLIFLNSDGFIEDVPKFYHTSLKFNRWNPLGGNVYQRLLPLCGHITWGERWHHPVCTCVKTFAPVGNVTSKLLRLEYRCIVHIRRFSFSRKMTELHNVFLFYCISHSVTPHYFVDLVWND